MNKPRFGLLLLILMAWALRLFLLGAQSLWYDEGVTWMLSQMMLPDLINWTAADIQPPFYYLLIWLTEIVIDDSEWALRFPSAFFGVATVPVIYVLARRLFPAPRLKVMPLIATLLFTLSPAMVYYSQEARMYTLLIFEATLAGYLLFKLLYPGQVYPLLRHPYVYLYIITTATALYTHYFAIVLLLTHMLYALFVLWRRHFPRVEVQPLLFSFGGSLLLFAPWLPILLARLGDDPSYWPGALKLDEALRKVAISFTVGETVFEETAQWLALGYLLILLSCGLWALGQWQKQPVDKQYPARPASPPASHAFFFLSLWLFLPLVLILVLSYQSPKFNPRYILLAYPAFVLLLALALSQFRPLDATPFALRIAFYVLRFTFFLFLLATAALSLSNWFSDPRFAKDDFKALAQFVRERRAEDETVLLSSGHMFPVWAYYYGWEGWTPLPWMQRLDVNRVTNLEIAGTIAEAVEGKGGVWLVTWQAEVIDPNGVAPFWLDRIGRRPVDAGDFQGVGLEHWRLSPAKINLLHQDPIQRPAQINFAGQVELLGMTQLNDTELALFWKARQPLPDDLILTFDLTDPEGFDWDRKSLVGRPGVYLYPPSRWPVGEIIMTRHTLLWQIGTPPGLYLAEVGLVRPTPDGDDFAGWDVLDNQDRPQRRTALLEFVNLSDLVEPESGPLPQDQSPVVDFFPIIGLRRSILPPERTAQPGDRLLLALLWQAGEFNLDDISLTFDLVDTRGQVHYTGSALTPSRRFSLPRWNPGDVVLGQYWLDIPPEVAPGPAPLRVHLINSSGFAYHEIFPFDQLEILPTERSFSPPEKIEMPLEVSFSEQVTLLGAACSAGCRAAPGETLTLTLYWRAETTPEISYTIFTHVLGPDQTVLINADHAPPKPIQGWVAGEIVTDTTNLVIPSAGLSPGSYPIEVGLYDASDPAFTRLPLVNGEDRVILPRLLTIE